MHPCSLREQTSTDATIVVPMLLLVGMSEIHMTHTHEKQLMNISMTPPTEPVRANDDRPLFDKTRDSIHENVVGITRQRFHYPFLQT